MDSQRLEQQATALFLGTAVIAAIVVGSLRLSGWSGGQLDNRIEPVFWAGAVLAGVAVVLFGAAAFPRARPTDDRGAVTKVRLLQTGLVLFALGPVLCIVAVFGDYWI